MQTSDQEIVEAIVKRLLKEYGIEKPKKKAPSKKAS